MYGWPNEDAILDRFRRWLAETRAEAQTLWQEVCPEDAGPGEPAEADADEPENDWKRGAEHHHGSFAAPAPEDDEEPPPAAADFGAAEALPWHAEYPEVDPVAQDGAWMAEGGGAGQESDQEAIDAARSEQERPPFLRDERGEPREHRWPGKMPEKSHTREAEEERRVDDPGVDEQDDDWAVPPRPAGRAPLKAHWPPPRWEPAPEEEPSDRLHPRCAERDEECDDADETAGESEGDTGPQTVGEGVPDEAAEPADRYVDPDIWEAEAAELDAQVSLHEVIEGFTALRHELKLQTKSTRGLDETARESIGSMEKATANMFQAGTAMEQMTAALRTAMSTLEAASDQFRGVRAREAEVARQAARPAVEALAELDEALHRGAAVIESARRQIVIDSAAALRGELEEGFRLLPWWRRWLVRGWHRRAADLLVRRAESDHRRILDALCEGYELILDRLQRALTGQRLERIACLGRPADPHTMTVLEAVEDEGQPPGTVIEEVRPGYLWQGEVLRFAEVRATRRPPHADERANGNGAPPPGTGDHGPQPPSPPTDSEATN